jgi:hypothetical protein
MTSKKALSSFSHILSYPLTYAIANDIGDRRVLASVEQLFITISNVVKAAARAKTTIQDFMSHHGFRKTS